jgi:hypothetical protein
MCVQLASRDGQYIGRFEYDIGEVGYGEHRVTIPSKYRAKLSHFKTDELAVLVLFKAECSPLSPGDLIGVTSWGASNYVGAVTIFVNASRLDARVFVPNSRAGQIYDCAAISPPPPVTAFDTECEVAFAERNAVEGINLRLFRFESMLPELSLKIALP